MSGMRRVLPAREGSCRHRLRQPFSILQRNTSSPSPQRTMAQLEMLKMRPFSEFCRLSQYCQSQRLIAICKISLSLLPGIGRYLYSAVFFLHTIRSSTLRENPKADISGNRQERVVERSLSNYVCSLRRQNFSSANRLETSEWKSIMLWNLMLL